MSWLNAQFSMDDAVGREQSVWELLVSDWGAESGGVKSFPLSGGFSLGSVAAIAIGPRSSVDRCWAVWDMQKIVANSTLWDYLRRISVGAPLCFAQPGNQGPAASAVLLGTGSIEIYASLAGLPAYNQYLIDSTQYRDTYLKANGSSGVFGPTATIAHAVGPATATMWMDPLLHLLFYLTPPTLPPPTKRFPLSARGQVQAGTQGVEQLVAQIPIFGRKTVRVQVQVNPGSVTADTADVRVAVIPNVYNDGGGLTPQEDTMATDAAVVYGKAAAHTLTDVHADYLMVYVKPNTAQSPNVNVNVVATDD